MALEHMYFLKKNPKDIFNSVVYIIVVVYGHLLSPTFVMVAICSSAPIDDPSTNMLHKKALN